jgi:hypothetical protein
MDQTEIFIVAFLTVLLLLLTSIAVYIHRVGLRAQQKFISALQQSLPRISIDSSRSQTNQFFIPNHYALFQLSSRSFLIVFGPLEVIGNTDALPYGKVIHKKLHSKYSTDDFNAIAALVAEKSTIPDADQIRKITSP